MERTTEPTDCPSCGATLTGAYCAQCGEQRPDPTRWSLRVMLGDALHAVLDTDNRLRRTLRQVLLRPGFLTLEFRRGSRRPYMSAFRFLLLANLLYFVVQPFTAANTFNTSFRSHMGRQLYSPLARSMVESRISSDDEGYADYVQRFSTVSDRLARSLVILLCPFLALGMAILYRGQRRYFAEHLNLSLEHFAYSLVVIYVAAFLLLRWLGNGVSAVGLPYQSVVNELTMSGIMFGFAGTWLARALRRLHGESRIRSTLKTIGLMVWFFLGMHFYRALLFLIAWAIV